MKTYPKMFHIYNAFLRAELNSEHFDTKYAYIQHYNTSTTSVNNLQKYVHKRFFMDAVEISTILNPRLPCQEALRKMKVTL